MRIGIVGTGNMGRVLGGGWAVHGHEVFFGARDADAAAHAAQLARAQGAPNVRSGSNRDAAAFGDVVVYGVRGVAPVDVVGDVAARAIVGELASDLGLAPVDMGSLRNARIVEPLGDVIRYLILGAGLGPYATLKVDVLQPAETGRFGGRRASAWWARNAKQQTETSP